jgi:hypothetical protein
MPTDPIAVTTTVTGFADFSDPGAYDSHVATWEWGDGTSSPAIIEETGGVGTITGSHAYTTPGVYTIRLDLLDDDGGSAVAEHKYQVVYDPAGGFVTAGGWFDSTAGSYSGDPTLTGKANFGLNARYRNNETVPTGETQFSLQEGSLAFHSTGFEWLVVANGRAEFSGTGTINGDDGYSFLVTLTDGDASGAHGTDMMRIKIWHSVTGEVIYDNQMGEPDDSDSATPLGGGSVAIHE